MEAHHLLRSARIARGISLEQVITQTRMSPRVAHALDEGRFKDLPGGIYARSYVRMFAAVVGLDRDTVEQVAPLLPDAADPLPVIREIVAEQEAVEARDRARARRICAAAITDAVVLLGMDIAVLECAARAAGANGAAVARLSAIPLAMVFVALAAIYFVVLAGISGSTLGARAWRVELLTPAPKLNLRTIAARAAQACLTEASMLTMMGPRVGPFNFESAIDQSSLVVQSTIDD